MNKPILGAAPQGGVPQPAVSSAAPVQPAAAQSAAPSVEPAAGDPIRDRTQENFEKLLDSNNRLFQQQQAQQAMLDQLLQQQQRYQAPAPAPVQPPVEAPKLDPNDFVYTDPTTGERYVHTDKLQTALQQVQQRAEKAEQTAQSFIQNYQKQQRESQEREAYDKYPELNPRSEKFDRGFTRDTRAFLTDSMLNPQDYGGRNLSFKDAADLIRAGFSPTQQQVAQSAQVAQAQAQAVNAAPTANQINKAQAAATIANQPPRAQAEITQEELQNQRLLTRLGHDDMLAERLKYTDHIFDSKRGSESGQQ